MVRLNKVYLSLLLFISPVAIKAAAPTDVAQQVNDLVRRGINFQAAGQNQQAINVLGDAVALAEKSRDRSLILLSKSSLGAVCTCARRAAQTETNLRECLDLAGELGDSNTLAVVWINLGNLLAAQGKPDDAVAAYEKASLNPATAAKANANAAAVELRAGHKGGQLNATAIVELNKLAPAPELTMLWLRCGQTDLGLGQFARAELSFRQALQLAKNFHDRRAESYALGELGKLSEASRQFDQALDLTGQAAFIAQEIQSPDALYRWEWQTGRIFNALGKRNEAIAAYRRAVQTLQPIRAELTQGCGAARPSFREEVAPVYYELADLLLQDDDALVEARDTIEQLKSAELDDYLQDQCAGNLTARNTPVQTVAAGTVVIHIIPLPDRTEVLLAFHEGLERVRLPVTATTLTAILRQFRLNLERRTTNQYLVEGKELYDWLITPLKAKFTAHQVDTLVFVPDGALRTVPFSALYDGDHYLIEQFAIAVTPGVTLLDAHPIPRGRLHALAAGLSEQVGAFGALPHVLIELQAVTQAFSGTTLLNQEFVSATLKRDFADEQYQIVHFATHGQMDQDIRKSFILTDDGRLTMDDLEQLLQPGRFRGKPVELLTLSACQTAAGDDRAALGLAGMAVKAGARSTLASLWFVQDESTAILMQEFYQHLHGSQALSKAKALQLAQLKLMHDPRYEHAGYWAPFLIIGNWL